MDCSDQTLVHYGVKGMKWGVRKKRPDSLTPSDNDSSTTKRVKNDYNNLSDKEFRSKYQTTKSTYAKRVARYGDPYMNAPLAKLGKRLDKSKTTDSNAKKMAKVAAKTDGALAKVGQAYVVDQMLFGGIGTDACKLAVKTIGMASITAYTMARGGYDIKWYDKTGRRVG